MSSLSASIQALQHGDGDGHAQHQLLISARGSFVIPRTHGQERSAYPPRLGAGAAFVYCVPSTRY